MRKKIEIAKSWFVLAQLLMILAGFMFAAGGIVLTNAQNTMNWGLDKAGQIAVTNCDKLNNISNYQDIMIGSLDYVGKTVESNIKIYNLFFNSGKWIIISSLISFLIGRVSLQRIKD